MKHVLVTGANGHVSHVDGAVMPGAFAFDALMHKLAKRPRMLTSEMGAELEGKDDESIADTLHWVPERFMS